MQLPLEALDEPVLRVGVGVSDCFGPHEEEALLRRRGTVVGVSGVENSEMVGVCRHRLLQGVLPRPQSALHVTACRPKDILLSALSLISICLGDLLLPLIAVK
jgi:hypothetical protein